MDKTDMIAPRGRLTLRVTAPHGNSEHVRPPVPTSGRADGTCRQPTNRREDEDMAPELPEALREVAERAVNVLAPETDLFEDMDSAGFGDALTKALRSAVTHPVQAGRGPRCTWPPTW